MRDRPIGVTVLAILFGLNGVIYVVLAMLALFDHGALVRVLHFLSPSGAGPEAIHGAMGPLQPLYYSGMAALTGAMAVGFWRVRNWARMAILAMIALSLALMVSEVRPLMSGPTPGAIVLTAVRLGLSAFWVWYLVRPAVRAAFRRTSHAARTSVGLMT